MRATETLVGSSSRDGQPRHVEAVHAGGVAADDPRIGVRGRLGLFGVPHPGQDLRQDLARLRKRRLAVRIVRAGIVNLSRGSILLPSVARRFGAENSLARL